MKEDFITCSDCNSTFLLSDMVKFIEHKKHNCFLEDIPDTKTAKEDTFDCIRCEKHFSSPLNLILHFQFDHQTSLIKNVSTFTRKPNQQLTIFDTNSTHSFLVNKLVPRSLTNPYLPLLNSRSEPVIGTHVSPAFHLTDFNKSTSNEGQDFDQLHVDSNNCDENQSEFRQLLLSRKSSHDLQSIINEETFNFNSNNDASTELNNSSSNHFEPTGSRFSKDNSSNMFTSQFINSQYMHESGELFSTNALSSAAVSNCSSHSLAGRCLSNSIKSDMFKCVECGNTFRQKVHLRKHIINHHTKNKPFQCPYCAYTTVERSHLTVHIRTHTGEKPYMCRVCDYTSTQNCTLKSHYLRRHPTSKVHCSLCDRAFVTEQERDNHQKVCLEQKNLYSCVNESLCMSSNIISANAHSQNSIIQEDMKSF